MRLNNIMLSHHTNTMETAADTDSFHKLSDNWVLWAHLPHNTDWTSLASYIHIATVETVEEAIAVTELLPVSLVENCMLFMMRKGIVPLWDDPINNDGGCFSYKVLNKNIYSAWRGLTYRIIGGSISNKVGFSDCVHGISISPKKNFCIIKMWMKNCMYQNPSVVNPVNGLSSQGCIFKKWKNN